MGINLVQQVGGIQKILIYIFMMNKTTYQKQSRNFLLSHHLQMGGGVVT